MKTPGTLLKYAVLMLLTTLLLQGCETLENHKKANSLDSRMQLYRESLRWEDWATVLSLYKPEAGLADASGIPSTHDLQKLEDIKIADVVKTATQFNPDQTGAHTSISIEYHRSSSNKIKKLNLPMDWWYNKKYKTWYTSTPLPDFKN